MGQVLVRDIDDEIIERLKEQAKSHGRSLEAELRLIIELAAKYTPAEFVEVSRRLREALKGRKFDDSVALLREDRAR